MKKKYLFFTFITIMGLTKVESQIFKFGPKIGLSVSNLTNGDNLPIDDTSLIENNSNIPVLSFHWGLILDVELSRIIGIQSEFTYSSEGFEYDRATISGGGIRAKLNYFNIPIILDFKTFKRNNRVSFQFGPQLGFLIADKLEYDNIELDSFSPASKTNISLVFGLQFKLKESGLFFQTRYARGVSEIWENSNTYSSVFSGSIGYLF